MNSLQEHFVKFIQQHDAQEWVAAHIKREFPTLAVGFVFGTPDSGELRAIALPNVSATPESTFSAEPAAMFDVYHRMTRNGEELFGVFSTRAQGEPLTRKELHITLPNTGHWVISTNSQGDAVKSVGYFRTLTGVYQVLTSEFVLNPNAELFASENRAVSSAIQTANEELMRWLQKYPDDLFRVHPGPFEQIVAEIFRDQGFEAEVLGSWNQPDGGIDIIAVERGTIAGPFRIGIQCKRYVKTRVVRADLVWALEGRLDKFRLNKGVFATTASFENSVLSDLRDHLWRIELRDFEMLTKDLQFWGQYECGSSGLWVPGNDAVA